MSGLSAALNFARSSLAAVATQTALTSRNVASANQPDSTRKTADVISLATGSVAVHGYRRSTDDLLLDKILTASSQAASGSSLLDGLKRLSETVGDPQSTSSPAALLSKFQTALQLYEQNPADASRAQAAVQGALTLSRGITAAAGVIASVRQDADAAIAAGVDKLKSLLADFKAVNDQITKSQANGLDMAERMDARDGLAKQISDIIGLRIVRRPNNDMALYTDSGVTLFETEPREVRFAASPALAAGSIGGALTIDGVDVTSQSSPMPLQSGSLFGLTKLRDDTSLVAERQVDELARGLVAAFAEKDNGTPATRPPQAGLFTYAGGPALPPAGLLISGLASTLTVNAAVDPAQGGRATALRDGGINGASYLYNAGNNAGYTTRLSSLIDGLGSPQSFDARAGLETSTSLRNFASSAAGWVEAQRKQVTTTVDLQIAVKARAHDALQKVTGVSLDDEMTDMLQLERSYQASSKLLSTVDHMLATLMEAVR